MAAIVLCLLPAWTGPAQAESADHTGLLARYDAPAGCPGQADFERQIAARASQSALRSENRLAVRITHEGDRMRGAVSFVSGAEERSIQASACGELAEALALIAALMLEPARTAETMPATVAPPQARSREQAGQSQRHSQAESQPQVTPQVEPPIQRDIAATNEPTAPLPAAIPTAATARSEPNNQPVLRAEPRQHQLAVLISGLWMRGVAPDAHAGFGASAEYRMMARRASLLARGGVRSLVSETLQREQGDVTFRWWSYAGALCAEQSVGEVSLAGCGALELGRLAAQGSDTSNARQAIRPWLAVGPALLVRWQVVRPVFLQLSPELLLPLVHHRYLLAENTVHLVPWLTFRVELSLGVRIW